MKSNNLAVIFRLLERLVFSRMLSYLKSVHLLPPLQTAYRTGHHSTETAVIKVLGDIPLCLIAVTLLHWHWHDNKSNRQGASSRKVD